MTALSAEVRPLDQYRARRNAPKLEADPASASLDPQEALRPSAILADSQAPEVVELALVWRQLVTGLYRVADGFFSDEHCYLVLSSETGNAPAAVEGRRLDILLAVLGGLRQKNIAIDLALAPSTVALNSRLALQSLGVTCKPSRAHPLLMLAAHAVRTATSIVARRSTFIAPDDSELTVIAVPRPDRHLAAILPSAELSVIRRLVEGLAYGEIASYRGTASRTIANQITAVFRRIKVSGRNELVLQLFLQELRISPVQVAFTQTLVPPDMFESKPDINLDASRRSA